MLQKGRIMTDVEYSVGPIDVRWGKDRYKFYVVGDSLYTEWVSGFDRSTVPCPLRGLSPNFTETTGRSSGIAQTVRISMLLVASSVIVFFSDYHKTIPLLAPFLLGLGSWWLANAIRKVVPRTWTVIRKTNGEDACSIVQPEKKSPEWLRFEKKLSDAILKVNESET